MGMMTPSEDDTELARDKKFITKDTGEGRRAFGTGAVRDMTTNKGRYDLIPPMCIRRVAQLYQRGADKYRARNWEMGIPSSAFMDSLKRHTDQYLEGDRSEDHMAAVVFNAFGVMFNEIMVDRGLMDSKMTDLPDYLVGAAEDKRT